MIKKCCFSLLLFTAACAPSVQEAKPSTAPASDLADVVMDKNDGCLTGPTEQFGRYLGDWNIQDWSLDQTDGKTWNDGKGARWNFTCVGDGIAVQDFWMPNGGGKGTNLRIYNPETESWDIVWTATGSKGTTSINAVENDQGDIVMTIVSPQPNPPRRIIFFKPDEDGWDWVQQMSFDAENKIWTDVYKIRATKR